MDSIRYLYIILCQSSSLRHILFIFLGGFCSNELIIVLINSFFL